MSTEKFFRKSDWIACWVTFIISLAVYTLTLQPTLGLEDSGELIVASDYLGVPHPPGYPIWSLLTWFFQWIFHSVTFHGQPNPAWAVNFFSGFSAASACGILALLISRSGMDLLRSLKGISSLLGEATESLFCCIAGISGGLLLAFGQGMWSQAVIAEVYTLNIFFQSLVLVFLYRWMAEPKKYSWLFLSAFVFGLGITNHQTLMFMGLAIAVAVLCNELEIFRLKHLGCVIGVLVALVITALGIYHSNLFLQFIGIAVCIISCLFIRHPFLVRDFVITGSMYLLLVGFNKWATGSPAHANWMWSAGPAHAGFWIWTLYALAVPVVATFVLPNGRIVGPTFLVMFIGLGFYLYMPISSDQNPPINWGYPRTWQGFMHAITRGQYERVKLAAVFTPRFLQQIGSYLMDLRSQFYGPIALLAAIPILFGWKTGRRNIGWLFTTLVAFLSVGIVFMILQNPKTDIQNLFIHRVQYIQSHAIYVLWLGYGILFLMAGLEALVAMFAAKFLKSDSSDESPGPLGRRIVILTKTVGVIMVFLLPFALIYKNYNDPHQLRIVGGAEQDHHDFGWQFGNWQLRGVEGIQDDLRYWYPDDEEFEKQWAAYPNKAYPPPMGANAIFFGGTDPGRFVPTYMIYSAKVRPDVYLITQNALADNTYMNVMRDLYGDQIWIPSPVDSNYAFQQYVQGVQSGKIKAGADVTTEGGKVQVQGVAGVMQINGFLSKMIFDHNQYRTETKNDIENRPTGSAAVYVDPVIDPETGLPPQRTFYVEESYVLPWMYPYLTPHGLIMKINNKPTPLSEEIIRNDTDFWNWYTDRLLNDDKFIRDIVARKSFCKLRSALAGLYDARGRPKESEAAFRQAVALYDLSPEANFRLANLMMKQGRFDEAIELFDIFLEKDPKNEQARSFLEQVKRQQDINAKRRQLEAKVKTGTPDFNEVMQLLQIYLQMNMKRQADGMATHMINNGNLQPQMLLQLAQGMAQAQRFQVVELALKKYTTLEPKDPNGWINLAALQVALKKRGEMLVSLRKAVEYGGEPARNIIRKDTRFGSVRGDKDFQKIVPPLVQPGVGGIGTLPGL